MQQPPHQQPPYQQPPYQAVPPKAPPKKPRYYVWIPVAIAVILLVRFMAHRQQEQCAAALDKTRASMTRQDYAAAREDLAAARDVCKTVSEADQNAIALAIDQATRPAAASAPSVDTRAAALAAASASAAIEAPKPATKADATAMLADLRDLSGQGKTMEGLKFRGDLDSITPDQQANQQRCIQMMIAAKPKIADLRKRVEGLPEPIRTSLGIAATSLSMCLTCVSSGDQACTDVQSGLKDATADLAKTKW